jgi:hypothetical protein
MRSLRINDRNDAEMDHLRDGPFSILVRASRNGSGLSAASSPKDSFSISKSMMPKKKQAREVGATVRSLPGLCCLIEFP